MPKRLFDILISLFALSIFIIPMLIIGILIKLTSKGPVIFWTERIGKNNIPFHMPKFRTMFIDAPILPTNLIANPHELVTPMGKILRKTSLDELPQVLSILKGDMSIVGPRPVLVSETELLNKRTKCKVHTLSPGLTGLAQISGRDNVSIDEKVALDEQYLQTHNLWLDIKIILKTAYIVLLQKGVRH